MEAERNEPLDARPGSAETEVLRLRAVLQAIAEFGRVETGRVWTCARMAREGLSVPPNAQRSATGDVNQKEETK